MKHLRQYIRRIILEAARNPTDLEMEEAVVVIDARDQDTFEIYYGQEKDPTKKDR